MREFRDLAGIQWSVFRATPHTSPSKRERILPETYRLGWLVFECQRERRRLAPVPQNWEALPESELERLCALADVVPVRGKRRTSASVTGAATTAPSPSDAHEPRGPVEATRVRAEAMQNLLAQVIDDVCEQPRAHALDTGELIRVEEALTIAAHTAREAVALRLAAREQQGG